MFANGDVIIQKFGGSAMGSVDRIKRVAERIASKAASGIPLAVVVSAMGDTTDDLIGLMHQISDSPTRCELDNVMATGEIISSALTASALAKLGIRAKSFNALNLQLISELSDGEYNITSVGNIDKLCRFLQPGSVAVVAGFQGLNSDGDFTTLGRGGSDLTTVVLAKWLGQKVCEKYTDEDGIYTADPRYIPDARKVWHLNYDEMLALSKSGNGILHTRAIATAKSSEIRIHVRSAFSQKEGSVVGPDGDRSVPIKSITMKNISNGKVIISLVGCGLEHNIEYRKKIYEAVKHLDAEMVDEEGIKVSFVLSENRGQDALELLHNRVLCSNAL